MTLNMLFFTITIKKVRQSEKEFLAEQQIEEIMEANKSKHYYMSRF
ncbi:YrzI family small protein [Niallia sp. NCCP-28]|nr:YrzI family small protein [Niallia sp. NCCP-28]GKU81358.1 hypothetical protein NCCP28_07540 [Niallia sp. NCCP-28]